VAIRSFLLLHGLENHRPPEHWQFWLASQLYARGHQVLYPGLPEPDAPRYAAWRHALGTQLAELRGNERVVICHSLSCLLWLRAAPALIAAEFVDRLLLVSPPESAQLPPNGAEFALVGVDAAAVRASVGGGLRVAGCDGDPFSPAGAQAAYGDPLGVTADILPGAGHITPASGYGAWPSVLAWCEDGARAIVGI
jgi:predicted alpha/beta hydrolase family esterase